MRHLGKHIVTVASAALLALTIAGCSSSQAQSADEQAAAQNRQYMATLNQQMEDLQDAMDDFQQAVSDKDVVGMQAQANEIDSIIDSVKNTDATDTLKDVKDDYVDALTTLDGALDSYITLYTNVQNGTVDASAYSQQLAEVQAAYDDGMTKLQAADDAVEQIAQG